MTASAALSHTASRSSNILPPTPRRALDTLEDITSALHSLRDLLIPGDDLTSVSRGDLGLLFGLLNNQSREGGERAELAVSARVALADLINPGHDLHCVSRDHLCALVDLLGQIQADALAQLFATDRNCIA